MVDSYEFELFSYYTHPNTPSTHTSPLSRGPRPCNPSLGKMPKAQTKQTATAMMRTTRRSTGPHRWWPS